MTRSLIRSPWRWPLLLAVVCAGLAAILAAEVGMPPEADTTQVDRPPQSSASVSSVAAAVTRGPSFTPGPLDSFADIVERPLFNETRRPAVSLAAQDGVIAPLADTSIQLTGVVLSEGRRIAVLQLEGAPRPVSVEVGSDVGGWKVEVIGAERVVLSQGEKSKEITIEDRMKAVAAMGAANRPELRRGSAQPERGRVRPGQRPPRVSNPPPPLPPAAMGQPPDQQQ